MKQYAILVFWPEQTQPYFITDGFGRVRVYHSLEDADNAANCLEEESNSMDEKDSVSCRVISINSVKE